MSRLADNPSAGSAASPAADCATGFAADCAAGSAGRGPRLGLRANAAQFALLVAVNALVGGMLGQERTVLPLLADQVFAAAGLPIAGLLLQAAAQARFAVAESFAWWAAASGTLVAVRMHETLHRDALLSAR